VAGAGYGRRQAEAPFRCSKLRTWAALKPALWPIRSKLDGSNISSIWVISDSLVTDEAEMVPCEISLGFSMSMIA
jgi:hypothetical protein